jgi:hypothetical protein
MKMFHGSDFGCSMLVEYSTSIGTQLVYKTLHLRHPVKLWSIGIPQKNPPHENVYYPCVSYICLSPGLISSPEGNSETLPVDSSAIG